MNPQRGAIVPFTIRLQQPFNFDQEKALVTNRMAALSQYVPLYTFIPNRSGEAAGELHSLLEKIGSLSPNRSSGPLELKDYMKTRYGIEVSEEVSRKLLRYRDLRNLISGILTLEESISLSKIIEDPQPIEQKQTFEVFFPGPSGVVAFPKAEVTTLQAARLSLQEKVHQLFWQVDQGVRDAILSIAVNTLKPNLVYDTEGNHQRIKSIIDQYPSTVIHYKSGDVLFPFRHELTDKDLPLLSAYREEAERDLLEKAPWTFAAIFLIALFYSLVFERIIKDEWRKDPPYHLFLCLMAIAVFALKTGLLLTPLPVVALPFGAIPLMLVLLQRDRISAVWTTLTAALLLTIFSGYSLQILLFFSFAGIVTVIFSLSIRKRIHILFASLAAGGANGLLYTLFWLDWGVLLSPFSDAWGLRLARALDHAFIETLGWAFVGGVASGPLAILLLPLLEMSWHTVSTFRLSRYADLQHPLLKELLNKTPATYQHTMTVAYLSESVGEALGADTLLLRIGAYYHDIGKVTNPGFFSENQPGKNPHDELDPQESARIIIDHVINGEKIGRGMKLPQVILDFVIQHHGTQAVEFFYNKAIKNSRGGKVQKKDFQYPGPKPQSVEAAIVMICDAVEAASRSLDAPSREMIEKMVRLLLVKRVAEGQFDECRLSTGCLAQIVRTLVDSLEASFHTRIVYPWQENQKKNIMEKVKAA